MNWVDVADTAVKIGLGALVAGAFGYFTAKLGHESERRARYSQRRRDHIEGILKLLTEVETKYNTQKWRLECYRFYLLSGDLDKAKEEQRQFDESLQQLRSATKVFRQSSSVLLLLGDTSSDKLLWVYCHVINNWLQQSDLDPSIFSDERAEKLTTGVDSAREKLFASLAQSYKES